MGKLLGSLALVAMLSGCAMTGLLSGTGKGGIYTDFTEAVAVTSNDGASKMGKACTSNILGIAAMGDASVDAAKKNGGISKVASIDGEVFNVLGLYGTYCTIVRGN